MKRASTAGLVFAAALHVVSVGRGQPPAQAAAQLLLERGARFEHQGRKAAALSAYTEAIQLAPSWDRPQLALADLRFQIGDVVEAQRLYQRLARSADAPAAVFRRLATLAEQGGDPVGAQRYRVRLCWTQHPSNVQDEVWRADCEALARRYEQQGLYLAALQVWRHIHALVPADAALSVRLRALAVLAAELDPALAGSQEPSWVRRSLARLARFGP